MSASSSLRLKALCALAIPMFILVSMGTGCTGPDAKARVLVESWIAGETPADAPALVPDSPFADTNAKLVSMELSNSDDFIEAIGGTWDTTGSDINLEAEYLKADAEPETAGHYYELEIVVGNEVLRGPVRVGPSPFSSGNPTWVVESGIRPSGTEGF